jgi:hypothetical protein
MIKSIHAPHLGRAVKLGRKRPVAPGPRLRLSHYLRAGTLPAPPPSVDYYSKKATAVLHEVYLNDKLGDCVVAAGYHVVGMETGNADNLFAATDAQILEDYSAIGGYVPGNPSTDNGCDEVTALNYWTSHGFANGTKLVGWLGLDPKNKIELMQAMWLFENLFFGIELPDAWIDPFPVGDGFWWDAAPPNPENGHAVVGVGYDSRGVQIDSWGLFGTLTWDAIAALCAPSAGGEIYVLLSPDQLKKGESKAPNEMAWSELVDDFHAIGGNVPVPAPAPPPPLPGPTVPQDVLAAASALSTALDGMSDDASMVLSVALSMYVDLKTDALPVSDISPSSSTQ